tara:strand:- start:100 stop:1605 length:1506 start_codon:yes stop_codon:yes gene_type:complete
MRKIAAILLLIFPTILFCQTSPPSLGLEVNDYKYFVIDEVQGLNPGETRRFLVKNLEKAGYPIINLQQPLKNADNLPEELIESPELAAYIRFQTTLSGCYETRLEVYTYDDMYLSYSDARSCLLLSGAIKNNLKQLFGKKHKYAPPARLSTIVEISDNEENSLDISNEKSIRDYLDRNGAENIEGIWQYQGDTNYKLFIRKNDFKYSATVIEKSGRFNPGDFKADFEPAAVSGIYSVKWTMADKRTKRNTVTTVDKGVLMKLDLLTTNAIMYKVYPALDSKPANVRPKKGEWAGNGSGIIISESGYIVTNNHVIENADEIEVEFVLNGEFQKFNAEIVQVDKVNDLAIIKIFDINFDGVDNLPYNFNSRSSDVGTKVYAYGYPMALSVMGKEIKVTDGIISAKSGFDGDITTYQITAAIQKGNSGGPLFDDKGNFIGINSAAIRKDIADNVAYSIKSNYVLNLIDVLPKSIDLPSSTKLESLTLTEQIKEISKYVVLIKVK